MSNPLDISPAKNAIAVTPGAALFEATRSLFIGGTGDVTVQMADAPNGTTVTFTGAAAGILTISCVKVTAATATNILALY